LPASYLIEESPEGRQLIVAGPWTDEIADILAARVVDGLTLNYARGFVEPDLDFLQAWPVRRLDVLDRALEDLAPIGRLGPSLESLSIEAAPRAALDLALVPHLRELAAWWSAIEETIDRLDDLEELTVMDYDEPNLKPLAAHSSLRKLVLKFAPLLEALDGAEDLPTLAVLRIAAARELRDITALASIPESLVELVFESCLDIEALDDLSSLRSVRLLGISDCGRIESLRPIATMTSIETLYAWGSTRIMDNDLTPLQRLPRLSEVRMRNRREYRPSLSAIEEQLAT
jgi:hypothetical protein